LEHHRASQFLKAATNLNVVEPKLFQGSRQDDLRFSDCTASVIQILDDADAAFRMLGAELRTVLSVTTMFADKPHRLNGRTNAQRFCVLTILPPVTALAVGLPAQRAIAQRFRALCRFSDAGMQRSSTRSGGRHPKTYTRHEIAGCWAPTVQRALWGFCHGVGVGDVEAMRPIRSLYLEAWACVPG
jgi:hypothetical protein